MPIIEALKTTIEKTLGSRLPKFENETRLILSKVVMLQTPSLVQGDAILYMTNAPFDEFSKFNMDHHIEIKFKENLDEYRNVLKTKKNPLIADQELAIEMANLNVQRKVNPMNDIFNTNETIATDTQHKEQELIVVASLIDKLPNLGGLARTCEVLGVKTLILSAKSLIDKPDFTNLR